MTHRSELEQLITRKLLDHDLELTPTDEVSPDVTDAILAAGWRPPVRVVTTVEERDALPVGVVVRSSKGTVACRHHSGVGVAFGLDRPFLWSALALPLTVLYGDGEG